YIFIFFSLLPLLSHSIFRTLSVVRVLVFLFCTTALVLFLLRASSSFMLLSPSSLLERRRCSLLLRGLGRQQLRRRRCRLRCVLLQQLGLPLPHRCSSSAVLLE